MENEEGALDPATAAWVQREADEYYEGNFGRAASAILEAAHAAELAPDDPWAYVTARQEKRGGRRPRT